MAVTVFMVAEKPSLAASIAKILSNGKNLNQSKKGSGLVIHEWTGSFHLTNGEACFKMTSVFGHVMALDFPTKYNDRKKILPEELFIAPTCKKEANPKLRVPSLLASEAKGCTYLVLWLDCDKEGENICFEVIDAVSGSLKKPLKPFYRAKFSSITDKDIKYAMSHLISPDENASKSVDARQELDLRIGCAFTRFQTDFFHRKYGNLDSMLISYGPCQTPTLGFCVNRYDLIQTFQKEQYWVLCVSILTSNNNKINLSWDRVRVFDKEVMNMFYNKISGFGKATVTKVYTSDHQSERPIALNTVELMKTASSMFSMSPHYAMEIAEKLYIQGYISYPRTESTHYHDNFNIDELLRQQQNSSDFGPYVKELLKGKKVKPRKGHDAGDHPPITPMKAATSGTFDADMSKIYNFIVRHFLGTVSPNMTYQTTTARVLIDDEFFSFKKTKVINPGFSEIMFWKKHEDSESFPKIQKDDLLEICKVEIDERYTDPPDNLSESDLIGLMEKHGIGTDASIPTHINTIVKRNFVTIDSKRKLIPTDLGKILVHGYQKIDPDLVGFHMRSSVEAQLDLIAQGKADYRSVLNHTLEIFKLKFNYFINNIQSLDRLFESSFSPLAQSGSNMSRCGKCRRYMKNIETNPPRLYCLTCDETYSMPINSSFKCQSDIKCPLDDFELIHVFTGSKGKSYHLCPYCYNNPPFPNMVKETSACNACTHPTCSYSQISNGLCNCVECETGILVLDTASAPKWKLCCNKCQVIVKLFDGALKVSVLVEEKCPECETQLLKVDYKEEKTKLSDNKTTASGCIFCHEELKNLVVKHHAVFTKRVKTKPSNKNRKAARDKMSVLANYFV